MAAHKKSLATPVKSTQDLEEDWASVKRSPAGLPEETHPDLTHAVQAVSPGARFRITIDGMFDPRDTRISTNPHPTLREAEQEALDILNERIRTKLTDIEVAVQETSHRLEGLRHDHFRLSSALPYLPPAPPEEPDKPELAEDDIPF